MKPLPSQWTYDRFLNKLDNGELKEIMAQQVKKLYELGIVDASLITGVFAKNSAAPSASPKMPFVPATTKNWNNGNSAADLNKLAHISALAVARAAVSSGSHFYRSTKLFRRSA